MCVKELLFTKVLVVMLLYSNSSLSVSTIVLTQMDFYLMGFLPMGFLNNGIFNQLEFYLMGFLPNGIFP